MTKNRLPRRREPDDCPHDGQFIPWHKSDRLKKGDTCPQCGGIIGDVRKVASDS